MLAVWFSSVVLAQGPGDVRNAQALYPCVRAEKILRHFEIETDAPEMAKMRAALNELGAEVAYGPRTSEDRPKHGLVVVLAPPEVSPNKLALALRKGGGVAHELACIAFDGRTGQDSNFGLGGFESRDFVMGLSGEIVWYDSLGTWSQFYVHPGKIDGAEIAKRYQQLFEPYGGARLGAVVRERFGWALSAAPDARTAARVLKAALKLAGVEDASLAEAELTVVVRLEDLRTCSVAGKVPIAEGVTVDEPSKEAPRAAFDTRPLYDLLAAEKLVP